MKAQHILVVDDNAAITCLLERVLKSDGHSVAVASDGQQALNIVSSEHPDLILTDLDMPETNGYEVCRRVKCDPATRLIPVLIITGEQSWEAKLQSLELGADDFLTKPFDTVEVRTRCRSLLRTKRLIDELDTAEAVVFAFARAMEAKCGYTSGHAERVVAYALALASRAGVSEEEQVILRKGALLHDIGKIYVPDHILNKAGKLTAAEFTIIKQHPTQGARIVEPLRSVRDTIPVIRWHHERCDGQGYPDGLVGSETPILARILAVADVYDALSSDRPYRAALPRTECLRLLRESADGGGLDPQLVGYFCDEIASPADTPDYRAAIATSALGFPR